MSTLEERKIAALEAEIKALEVERRLATTPEDKRSLLDAITAIRQDITALRAQAAAAGNYTARDLTSFI